MAPAGEIAPLIQYLLDNELMVEEGLLLYTVYVRTDGVQNKELLKVLTQYHSRMQYYDAEGSPIAIPWNKIVTRLVDRGWLIAHPGHARKDTTTGLIHLDTSRLEVTDKFRSSVVYSDKDKLFELYIAEIYGPVFYVNNQKVLTTLQDKGETFEDIKDLFWKKCGNGIRASIAKFFSDTEAINGGRCKPTMKLITFLKGYDGLLLAHRLEEQANQEYNKGGSY